MTISNEIKLELYKKMVLVRSFESEISRAFAAGELKGFYHTCLGEEALCAGTGVPLRKDDRIFTTHRCHGQTLVKGLDPRRMMAEIYGRIDGCCRGRGGSIHLADRESGCMGSNGIVGKDIAIAVGAAYAQKYRKSDAVTVAYFGDGACGTGAFHEGLNMAGVMKLPIIFVCHNNLYAQMTSIKWHCPIKNIADRAVGYGMPGQSVDGNDVFRVYESFSRALKRARVGQGPSLIEGKTFRWHGHYEGDPCKYLLEGELEKWMKKDPIKRCEKVLKMEKLLTDEEIHKIAQEAESRIKEAVEFARKSPSPGVDEVFKDILV